MSGRIAVIHVRGSTFSNRMEVPKWVIITAFC